MNQSQRVLICRVVWAEEYSSENEEFFAGRMRYPIRTKHAAELLNFKEDHGYFYGFVENRGQNINIEKLGASKTSDFIESVKVIFCSVHKESMSLRVVGWFENATVYREMQSPIRGSKRGRLPYYFKAPVEGSILLDEVDRNLLVPTKEKINQRGFIGQRNVFYPAYSGAYSRFLEAVALASQNPFNRSAALKKGESVSTGEYDREYQEGQRLWQEVMISARSPRLVKEAKRYHGTTCQVCGFNFGAYYGSWGEGFIEVHHRLPIARNGSRRSTIKDVDVVCANCHCMIHRKSEAISVEDLKRMIVSARSRTR